MKKISILGAGAMGCYFAAKFAAAGEPVMLIDPDVTQVDAINTQGLISDLEGMETVLSVEASCSGESALGSDLVVVLTKANRVQEALVNVAPHLAPTATVVVLANGLGCGAIAAEILGDALYLLHGVTAAGAVIVRPGVVRPTLEAPTYVSNWRDGGRSRAKAFVELCCQSGLTTHLAADNDELMSWIWTKLVINASFNAATALTGVRNGLLIETDVGRGLIAKIIDEVVAVASKKGIALMCKDALAYALEVGATISENNSSMLADVVRGRPTEVSYINGAIAAEGCDVGIETPVNQLLTDLLKLREIGEGVS